MARLNLEAKNQPQELILQYLEQNASESLAERINQGNHTLQDCFDYIRNEARKQAVNGVAAIEDRQVYGWAVHYFEENGKPKAYNVTGPKPVRIVREAKKEEPKPEQLKKEPKPKKADAEQITGQTSIFDFL